MSWAIHTETKPYSISIELNIIIFDHMMRLMKLNLQIIEKYDKTKQTKVV